MSVARKAGPVRWACLVGAIALLVTVGAPAPAVAAPGLLPQADGRGGACTADDQDAVTVVIDFQNLGGGIKQYCATGLKKGAVGMDALRAVGISTTGTTHDGSGFVCRLNGRPSAKESIRIPGDDDYRENCVDTPPATAYWSYWWAEPGGSWAYSNKGVLSHRVVIGGYEGWSFSNDPDGGYGGKNPPPGVDPVKPKPVPPPATPTTPEPTPSPTTEPTTSGSTKPTTSTSAKPSKPSRSDKPKPTTPSLKPTGSVTPKSTGSISPPPSITPTSAGPSSTPTPSVTVGTPPPSASASTTAAEPPAQDTAPPDAEPGWGLYLALGLVAVAGGAAAVIALRHRR